MATKTFKYGHLFSLNSGATPQASAMIPGEIALNLSSADTRMFAYDGTKVIDLGAKLGGQGDEITIHSEMVDGVKKFSSLVYVKEMTGTTLPANVYKRYALVDNDGNNVVTSGTTEGQSGNTSEFIDIYKDSSIVEIYEGTEYDTVNEDSGVIKKYTEGEELPASAQTTGHTAVTAEDFHYLNYVYYAGGFSGSTSGDSKYYMTQIDLSRYLTEGEFASGVTAVNGVVTGVVDSTQDELIVEWTDGDASAAGVSSVTINSGLTVGESGFSLNRIQDAINAKHANTIPMNGYTSGETEDLFGITSGLTVMQSIKKIEDKLYSNGDGKPTEAELNAGTNNTGIVFVEGSNEIVILSAGKFGEEPQP